MVRTILKKLIGQHAAMFVVPAVLILAAATASTYAHTAVSSKSHPAAASKHIAGAKTAPKTAPPASTVPAPVPPPVAVPVPVKTTPKVVSAPVVTPAPSSSVTNLVPTDPVPAAPASPPPSSGSAGSSGSATPPATTTSYTSTNWSGYLATSGNYTSVSGSWVAPSATGNGVSTSADAAWIGIGGVTSGDLIQIGTDNTVSPSGQVSTEAFYEMLPAASIPVPNLVITPGDAISASVTETSANVWLMTINDTTTGQSFSITINYASSQSSAEWIEEDPSYGNGRQVPFDFFSAVTFAHAAMVANGTSLNLTGGSAVPITMVTRSGHAIATPSAIAPDGASFTVTHN